MPHIHIKTMPHIHASTIRKARSQEYPSGENLSTLYFHTDNTISFVKDGGGLLPRDQLNMWVSTNLRTQQTRTTYLTLHADVSAFLLQ